jgi:hypothetical protein
LEYLIAECSAARDARLSIAIESNIAIAISDIAVARVKGPTRSGDRRARNPTHDSANRPADRCTRDDPGRRPGGLLWGLTPDNREPDERGIKQLSHGDLQGENAAI